MQAYSSGEEVRLGDVVTWPGDQGTIIALEADLPRWGLTKEASVGKVMIRFSKTGLVCEESGSEDLRLVRRADEKAQAP